MTGRISDKLNRNNVPKEPKASTGQRRLSANVCEQWPLKENDLIRFSGDVGGAWEGTQASEERATDRG